MDAGLAIALLDDDRGYLRVVAPHPGLGDGIENCPGDLVDVGLLVDEGRGARAQLAARVVSAKDPARAAVIFDKINTGRRLPSGIEKFRVRVTAGAETEVAINKVVSMLGYRIDASPDANCIRATAALINVHNVFGLEVLRETLSTIRTTWRDDKGATEGPIIEGFGSLIGEHRGHLDWKRLREKTALNYTPGRLLGQAKADKETLGGRLADGIRRVLIRNYNQGLRAGKLGE